MKWMFNKRYRLCIFSLLGGLLLLPALAKAYFIQEYPPDFKGRIFPSHDLYGSFSNLPSIDIEYNYSAVIVQPTFYPPEQCHFYLNQPTLNFSQLSVNHIDGYVVFLSYDVVEHRCGGIAQVLDKLNLRDGYNPTLFRESQKYPVLLILFSSSLLEGLKIGSISRFQGRMSLKLTNHMVITDQETGNYIESFANDSTPLVVRFIHEYGPWDSPHTYYLIALDRRTLFVMIFFSLVYASCQIINLFYQEGWVVDTRIILYVSSITWFIGSLLRLSTCEPMIPFDLVYHVMKLIAFSGYTFVQLKWGQILAKLLKRRIYKVAIYWGIFAICNNIVMLVLLIVRALHPNIDKRGIIVNIYSFYIPILYLGQSFFFLYFGFQFYKGMKALCMSSRTKSSFRKLSLLCFLAGIGFMIQVVALVVQGTDSYTVSGNMAMVTLAILSGLICFTPVFVILSIRGTDENATYAAVLNSTRVSHRSTISEPNSKPTNSTKTEEIKLECNTSQQPLRADIPFDMNTSDSSASSTVNVSQTSSVISEHQPTNSPSHTFKPMYQPTFTPLNPPPRPHIRREHSDRMDDVPHVPIPITTDRDSIVMERCREVVNGECAEHSSCVVDWRPSFGLSDDDKGHQSA